MNYKIMVPTRCLIKLFYELEGEIMMNMWCFEAIRDYVIFYWLIGVVIGVVVLQIP